MDKDEKAALIKRMKNAGLHGRDASAKDRADYTKLCLDENPPQEITVVNLKWLEKADADEIVKRFISVIQQTNSSDAVRLLDAFLKRSERDTRIGAAYKAFSSKEHPEAHSCVGFNIKIGPDEWTQDVGQGVFEENYQRELARITK